MRNEKLGGGMLHIRVKPGEIATAQSLIPMSLTYRHPVGASLDSPAAQ